MGRRPAPRVLTLTFLFVAAILAFALVVSPTTATLTASTANPGTSLSSTNTSHPSSSTI